MEAICRMIAALKREQMSCVSISELGVRAQDWADT
jgi:hypothetical protein